MRNLSTAFKQLLANDNRSYLGYCDITLVDGTTLTADSSVIWTNGFSLDSACSSETAFTALGSVIVDACTVTLNNIDDTFSSYDFTDAKIVFYVALNVNGTEERIKMCSQTVDKAIYNGALIRLSCLSNLSKLDRPYSDSSLVYPATLQQIVNDACTVCGITLGTTTFPHYSYTITTKPEDSSITFREVLSWVAAIAGTFVTCNSNGDLVLKWFDTDTLSTEFENPTYTNNSIHYIRSLSSQTISTNRITITGVQAEVKVADTENNQSLAYYTSGTDDYLIKLINNGFINSTNAQEIVNWLGTLLIGVEFNVATISHLNDPSIEVGDVALIIDRKNNISPILITNTIFNIQGYQATKCSAEEPVKNTTTRYTESTKAFVETKKMVQQEKTAREQMGEDLETALAAKAGMYETRIQESGGGYTYYMHDKPLLANSTAVIKITNEAVGVTPNYQASPVQWYGLTVDGNFIANIMSVIGINFDWGTGGTLVLGGQNNVNGSLTIKDANNNTIGSWSNAGIIAHTGQIGGWKIDDDDIVYSKTEPSTGGGTKTDYLRLSYHALYGMHSTSNTAEVAGFDLYADGRLVLTATETSKKPLVQVKERIGVANWHSILNPNTLAFYYSGAGTTDPVRYLMYLTADATGLSLTAGYCITASYLKATSALTINKLDPNIISNGTNLNTITNDGWYYCPLSATASTLTNCPTDQAFYMEVHTHAGTYQHIVTYNTAGGKHFHRNYYNGTWGSWIEWKLTDSVTGVKGNAESSYRTGNVNLTPANIGALALTGGTLTGNIVLKITDYTRGSYSAAGSRGYLVTDSSGSANTVGSIYIGVNSTGHYSLLRVNDPTAGSSKGAQIILYYPFNDGTPYADWPSNFRITATGRGYYLTDSTGTKYGAIYDNGDNLWIGAVSGTIPHHRGAHGNTFISSGYNTTNNTGNSTIYISVPSLSGSTWSHNTYGVLHTGNVASYAATGVKGNAETSYRKGPVNLTPANIGALALSGGTLTGALTLTGGGVRIDRDAAVQVDFRANNKTADVALRINSDGGNVGLYSYTKSGWIIRMASGGTVTVATTVSDIREKDVIGIMSDVETETILRSMDIIDYTYKKDNNKLIYSGISAQQLRDTLITNKIGYRPYLCIESTDESGISYHDLTIPEKNIRYEIDYVKFTPLLWKGWQLHDKKIISYEKRIKELEALVEKITNKLGME